METNDIKKLHGKKFRADIRDSIDVEGVITVEDGHIYLCQNEENGMDCRDKQGYKYSYVLPKGTTSLCSNESFFEVTNLKIMNMTKQEIEEYKDFQTGDVVKCGDNTKTIEGRMGDVCFVIKNKGEKDETAYIYSINELYMNGYRLVVEEEPEPEIVELTLEEIAELKGIKVEQLRIKD